MAEQCGDSDVDWSEDTVSLKELAETVCFPCVARVCEGYDSGDDISTFSLGDLLKIDSCERIEKVRARFVEWSKTSYSSKSSSDGGCYVKIDAGDISIPIAYKGCVRVLPKHGQYHIYTCISDVLNDSPRHLEILKPVNAFTSQDTVITLATGDILETIGWKKPKDFKTNKRSVAFLKCKINGIDTVLDIPTTIIGQFQVLRDDMEYTLKEVIKRFPLPQIVQFTEQFSKEMISTDIMEAIENLDIFDGKVRLESSYIESVLIGHYKGLQAEPEGNKFFKRTAFMLPLSNTDLSDISVQYPLYMDSSDYQMFLAKNFTQTPRGPKVMDRALYVEFTKKAQMRFTDIDETTEIEQAEDEPPPRPPRGHTKPVAPVKAFASSISSSSSIFSKPPIPAPTSCPPCSPVSPVQPNNTIFFDPTSSSLSDIDWSSGDSSKLTGSVSFKKVGKFNKLKKLFKRSKSSTEEPDDIESVYEISDSEESDEEGVYDYPDMSKLEIKKKNKGYLTSIVDTMSRVSPYKHKDKDTTFSQLTVEELQQILKLCSMDKIVEICQKESYDGHIFSKFSNEDLKSKPFNMTTVDLIKLEEIKRGWRPNFKK